MCEEYNMDEDLSWVWRLSADEMFEAIREGKVDEYIFAAWVELKCDDAYNEGRSDGDLYGQDEG
jgi:hypothetical protein